MKTLTIFALTVLLGAAAFASESKELTVSDKARTSSFVYKAELFLGCKEPFGMNQGPIPKERLDFVQTWLSEDVNGIGESEAGKAQKKRMTSFLENIAAMSDAELKPEWKGKDVHEIAKLINADLLLIAQAAGVTLESDKETQNNAPGTYFRKSNTTP
jgi:hypothetical protein